MRREPDAGGERVHRDADLPAVVVVRHAGEAEGGRGVARGERERVAAVRPIAFHRVLQDARCRRRSRSSPARSRSSPRGTAPGARSGRPRRARPRPARSRRRRASRRSCRSSRSSFPAARPSSGSRTPRRASWPRRRPRTAPGSVPRTRRRSCGRGSSGRRRACGGPRAGCRRARACRRLFAGSGSRGRSRLCARQGTHRTPTPVPASRRPSPSSFFKPASWPCAPHGARRSGEYGMTPFGRAARVRQGPSRVVNA